MTNDNPKKRTSLVEMIKQKLIGDLLGASQANRDATGNVDAEALRKSQLEILGKYDDATAQAGKVFDQLAIDATALEKFAKGGSRSLNALLVSPKLTPFDTLPDLDRMFGPLPRGFSYRYLAPPTSVTTEAEANVANNVMRLPSSFNLVLDEHFDLSGDEIPDRSLADWLEEEPANTYRLWTLRVLSLFGLLKKDDVPAIPLASQSLPASGSVLAAGSPEGSRSIPQSLDDELKEEVDSFRAMAVMQYDGETEDNDSYARNGVFDKKAVYARLKKKGSDAITSLGTLLRDKDIGVRVSAATYLLATAPGLALPVLRAAANAWPEVDDDRVQRAAYHAQQAIWMYEDGNLEL
jgi:hypothetical protein